MATVVRLARRGEPSQSGPKTPQLVRAADRLRGGSEPSTGAGRDVAGDRPTAIRRTGSPRRTASRGLDSDRETLAGLSCCEDDVTESFLHYKTACLYICWNRQELHRFATFVASAWIVFGVVLWTGSDMPRVVLLALIALGVAIGEVHEARKRRRPSSALVDARST
jgi:hypothetical protein